MREQPTNVLSFCLEKLSVQKDEEQKEQQEQQKEETRDDTGLGAETKRNVVVLEPLPPSPRLKS
jgi:hypothetical protein